MTSIKNSLFYFFLWLLPKNLCSRLVGNLASLKLPKKFAHLVNSSFVSAFKLDMSEAQYSLDEYRTLQDLFTRRLKPGVRVIDNQKDVIVSPCDGFMSEAGRIRDGQILQVKGKYYDLASLLASSSLASRFENGYFMTIYLSPRDYHRFHVPLDGKILNTIYIPGTLWPVNPWAVANIKSLFCQNERVISLMQPINSSKKLAHVAVGATNVGQIKLAYCELTSNTGTQASNLKHDISVKRGEDLGEFRFGSTIVLLFEAGLIDELLVQAPAQVRVGQALARFAQL